MSRLNTKNDERKSKYKQATDLEHMRNQTAMYLGGKKLMWSYEYLYVDDQRAVDVIRGKLETSKLKTDLKTFDAALAAFPDTQIVELVKVQLTPAALKCFDEILVNAIDQYTLHQSDIWVSFDRTTGIITIRNDRSCIPVFETQTIDGRKMWNPQLLFGEFKTSGNFDLTEDSTTGGVFGTGAKGVVAFSKRFTLRTFDPKYSIMYTQTWHDCMSRVDAPSIVETSDTQKPFTEIEFLLNFEDFEMTSPDDIETLYQLAYMRVLHTAVFNSRALVYWNGEALDYGAEDFVRLCLRSSFDPTLSIKAINVIKFDMYNAKKLRWSLTVAAKDNRHKLEQMSVINGIYVKSGTHLETVVDQIVEHCKPLYLKLLAGPKSKTSASTAPRFDRNAVLRHLSLLLVGYINRPSFTGQRKDAIDTPQEQFREYVIPSKRLDDIWQLISPFVELELIEKTGDKTKKRRQTVKAKKYTQAKWASGPRALESKLFITEGDSAFGTVDIGIGHINGYDEFGIFSIQGVPMSIRKEISKKTNPKTGQTVILRSKRLRENERLNALVQILNLDYTKNYSTDAEWQSLNYGGVIIACDQDEDGIGNIRSQIFNFFWTLWPDLVNRGFVKFLTTPLIRAFHRRGAEPIQEFLTDSSYKKWLTKFSIDTRDWEIIYYKGLGSHQKGEIQHMFEQLNDLIITFTTDVKTEKACEIYFGCDPDLRKIVLTIPPRYTEDRYYTPQKTISATNSLNTGTKSYQLYNISRHLRHTIDGLLPGTRKITATVRRIFKTSNSRTKVLEVSGKCIECMGYHHGDASLNGSIVHMNQSFPGAREFPFMLAMSNYGTRKKGGSDAMAARYGYTKLNKQFVNALLPEIDNYILRYVEVEGQRCEPEFYVPIICYSILESYSSPGHGWSQTMWARDYWEVSEETRRRIVEGAEYRSRDTDFGLTCNRFRHDLKLYKGVLNSVGRYHVSPKNPDMLIITELPMRMWNEHFLHGNPDTTGSTGIIDYPEVVGTPVDESTDDNIHIKIKFKPGFLTELTGRPTKEGEVDPVVKYLGLKQSLKSNINMMSMSGAVQEFSSYMDVFNVWFPVRQEYYHRRVQRMSIILRLKIVVYGYQIRFIEMRESLNLSRLRKDAQCEILHKAGFHTVDFNLLNRPNYTAIDELENRIMNDPNSSYDYLRKMDSDDISEEGLQALRDRVTDTQRELDELEAPDAVQKIWLKELDTLDAIVKRGQTEGWLYGEPKVRWAKK